jgi:hypothetical protein
VARDDEQPYERLLNDATGIMARIADGWLFLFVWLFGAFLIWMVLVAISNAIFGGIWSFLWYFVFFGWFLPAAWLCGAPGETFSDQYGRRGGP